MIPTFNENKIKEIEKYGKSFRGRSELIKHLKGEILTQRQGILAKCYDCTGYYSDSVKECELLHCPLQPHNPYNKQRIIRKTTAIRKPMTDETKAKLAEGLKKYRKTKKK